MIKLERRSVVRKDGQYYVRLEKTGKLIPAGGYSSEEDAWHLLSLLSEHQDSLRDELTSEDVEPGDSNSLGRSRLLPGIERRTLITPLEFRAASEGSTSPGTLAGYAALFDVMSEDLGSFKERIAPGAFARALKQCDIRSLRNHEPESLLGRCSSGTLRLEEDEKGLRMEVDLPDTTAGRDTAEMVRRGDMSGCSFSFSNVRDGWDYSSVIAVRTLFDMDVADVGPVTFPAYTDTSVALRSLEANRPAPKIPIAFYKQRLRLSELF